MTILTKSSKSVHGSHEGSLQLAPSIYEQTIDRGNLDANSTRAFEVLTIAYKTVGALSILADIYYPQSRETVNARPIGNPATILQSIVRKAV